MTGKIAAEVTSFYEQHNREEKKAEKVEQLWGSNSIQLEISSFFKIIISIALDICVRLDSFIAWHSISCWSASNLVAFV